MIADQDGESESSLQRLVLERTMGTRILRFTVLSFLQFEFFLHADVPNAKQTLVTISPETTRITKPLDADGFVDYVAALNQAARQGVTRDNNYEVVAREIMGPIYSGQQREEYFRRLGNKLPSPDGNLYIPYPVFAELGESTTEYARLMGRPWTTKEFPKAAKWVKLMNGHLNRIVEGSKRPKFYTPYTVGNTVSGEEESSPLMNVSLEAAQQQREIARGLMLRAMQRIGEGDLDDAWSDLQAIRRMSRHVAHGSFFIEFAVGCALDAIAFSGERQILQSPQLTANQARRYLADLQNVPRLPSLAEIWNNGDRLALLDAIQFDVRDKPEIAGAHVDWNIVFQTTNRWCDRLAKVLSEEVPSKRQNWLKKFELEIKQLKANHDQGKWKEEIDGVIDEGNDPTRALSRNAGEVYFFLLCPAFQQVEQARGRALARLDLIRLGFALEIFRRQNARYPDSLDEITPDFVEEIPADPITGKEFVYRSSDEGALIYSVSDNNRDDQGQAAWDDSKAAPDADDITVRVGKPISPPSVVDESSQSPFVFILLWTLGILIMLAFVVIVIRAKNRRKDPQQVS